MIRLSRDRTKVPPAFLGKKREAHARDLITQARAKAFAFKSAVWKVAKEQLRTETSGKCAYCEADTAVVAHGDVEHFRPKHSYWWLAYSYDNYLFSCQVCNQSFKANEFPISGKRLRAPRVPSKRDKTVEAKLVLSLFPDPATDDEVFLTALKAEKAHLPNPYLEDPEALFAWEADDHLKEVRVIGRGKSVRARASVAAVKELLGLNRDELRRLRFRQYLHIDVLAKLYRQPRIPANIRAEAETQLVRAMDPDAPFAAMTRYFIRNKWKLKI